MRGNGYRRPYWNKAPRAVSYRGDYSLFRHIVYSTLFDLYAEAFATAAGIFYVGIIHHQIAIEAHLSEVDFQSFQRREAPIHEPAEHGVRNGARKERFVMKFFVHNEHAIDRGLRIVLGVAVLSLVVVGPQTLWGLLGLVPLVTGLLGSCPVYSLLGLSTCSVSDKPARQS